MLFFVVFFLGFIHKTWRSEWSVVQRITLTQTTQVIKCCVVVSYVAYKLAL